VFEAVGSASVRDWTFLTDHAHVLVLLARDPRSDVSALSARSGVDRRRVEEIVEDLEATGYIRREDRGDVILTTIDRSKPLRHGFSTHLPGALLPRTPGPRGAIVDWRR
jgi:hypothetical protein